MKLYLVTYSASPFGQHTALVLGVFTSLSLAQQNAQFVGLVLDMVKAGAWAQDKEWPNQWSADALEDGNQGVFTIYELTGDEAVDQQI